MNIRTRLQRLECLQNPNTDGPRCILVTVAGIVDADVIAVQRKGLWLEQLAGEATRQGRAASNRHRPAAIVGRNAGRLMAQNYAMAPNKARQFHRAFSWPKQSPMQG